MTYYSEDEARKLVVDSGIRLLEASLAARTWGNISARISEDEYIITPSGLGYENMTPEDLVLVSVSSGAYKGLRRPSSEKGMHSEIYRIRPDVRFIIHTHQQRATVFSVALRPLEGLNNPVLGDYVPCAGYGLSSTKKLARAVSRQVSGHPSARAVLMPRHGAVCMGKDADEAFLAAEELERESTKALRKEIKVVRRNANLFVPDFGSSSRIGNVFKLDVGGIVTEYKTESFSREDSGIPALHAAIYKNTDENYIMHSIFPDTMLMSMYGKTLPIYLDDLAQIGGLDIRCVSLSCHPAADEIQKAVEALSGRNAVMVKNTGAVCTGRVSGDDSAVAALLEKNCFAARFAAKTLARPLNRLNVYLQRSNYVKKYAAKKNG